jgi:hypothetical protein
MNLSSGGLAILAIAAIWFLVFLPSFVKGEKIRVETESKPKVSTTNRLGEKAQRALSARRTRTIFATLTTAAFVVAGLSFLEVATNGTGLPLAIGSIAGTGLFAWLTLRANRNYRALLSGATKRTIPITPMAPTKSASLETSEEKTWQPEELPKQSFLQTGAIEIVELAEVTELSKKENVEEDLKIDEILRRRRHVG